MAWEDRKIDVESISSGKEYRWDSKIEYRYIFDTFWVRVSIRIR